MLCITTIILNFEVNIKSQKKQRFPEIALSKHTYSASYIMNWTHCADEDVRRAEHRIHSFGAVL